MADFSLIIWSSDAQETEGLCIPSLTPPWQRGEHQVETITVPPAAKARNMGQVYTHAKNMARFPIKIYAHQDIVCEDRDYLTKLSDMLEQNPRIGVVGMVGSTIDTGGAFFHAPTDKKLGECAVPYIEHETPGSFFKAWVGLDTVWHTRFTPARARVKVVDCLLFASPLPLDFATCYLKTHMVAEDYCMRARAAGYEVWIIDSLVKHFSQGKVDQTYWESMRTFRRRWRHVLPDNLPPLSECRYVYEHPRADGGWDDLWKGDTHGNSDTDTGSGEGLEARDDLGNYTQSEAERTPQGS